jgi:DNA-binding CsgD family transcriptional regulator
MQLSSGSNPRTASALEEADVRAMIRLVGEIDSLPGSHAEKKRYLMDGLCQLVGGDGWVWGLRVRSNPNEASTLTHILCGGPAYESSSRGKIPHPDSAEFARVLAAEAVREDNNERRAGMEEKVLVRLDSYKVWEAAGLYPGILCSRPLDARSHSAVAIFRCASVPRFTERETRIAHILLTEVPWLHELNWQEDHGIPAPRLAPRQRVVLNLLLEGRSRKEISDHMGISINTVAGYVRDIYKHFGVQSHAELMKLYMKGDGNDTKTTNPSGAGLALCF